MAKLSDDAARRAAAATRLVERWTKNDPSGRGRWSGEPSEWQRFRLTEALTEGGSATATRYRWDSSADGGAGAYFATSETITVRDTTSSWGPATSGTSGWCRVIYSQNGPVFEIMDLECDT